MTIAERIQLHKMGYTKEEIKELINAEFDPKGLEDPPKEVEPPEQADPPKEVEKPEQADPPKEVEKPAVDTQAEILKALQGLTATIQKSNIIQSRQPEPLPETAEDILSKLL